MAGTVKMFCIRKNLFAVGEKIYCFCHATWLPCKTAILPGHVNKAVVVVVVVVK